LKHANCLKYLVCDCCLQLLKFFLHGNMSNEGTETDGPGKLNAGVLLMKPESSPKINANNSNNDKTRVEVDARGVGDGSGFFSKRKVEASSTVAEYNMTREHRGHAVIVNNENFHWSTGIVDCCFFSLRHFGHFSSEIFQSFVP